jgi:type IX secretion system PorP/SprF family membrane protein
MRRLLQRFFLLSFVLTSGIASAQDIPLFSQKLTNSFVFNPALAGHTFGSITYSYKRNYAKVNGSPENHFLSFHAPFANHRFGAGANIYQEDVTFLRNTYASAAFAYHLRFDKFNILSFGIAGEYNSIGVNGNSNSITDPTADDDYNNLVKGKLHDYDFSFGVHYQNRFLKVGVAANRMANSWLKGDKAVLSYYYSGFAQGLIPLRGGEDLLEPYVAYRKLSETNNTLDVGLFYTYNNLITLGVSERSGKVFSGTLALHISKYLTFGYSREMILGNVGGFVGAANELTIRYDFNNESYKERFSSDYKSSMAFRRKTLSGPVNKNKGRSPKQLHRKQKKLAPYSPNRRYQNIKKLSVKTSGKKKSFKHKKGRKSPPKRRK